MEQTDSQIVKAHVPALIVAAATMCVYDDSHTFCFSCDAHHQNDDPPAPAKPAVKGNVVAPANLNLGALPARGITEATCKRYGYYKASCTTALPVRLLYRRNRDSHRSKSALSRYKTFETRGDLKHRFFGQHLFAAW